MDESELHELFEIIKIYNQISDLLWVGDFESIKTTLEEQLPKIKRIDRYLEEEKKWKMILNKINRDLMKFPREERRKKRPQILAEKCLDVDANKVIAGTLVRELQEIKECFSQPSLHFFSGDITAPVKKKKYVYLLLKITDRSFEVRALIEKLPDENMLKKMIKDVKERWGYLASEYQITNHSFFMELFSPQGYIKVQGFHRRVRMLLSFQRAMNIDKVRDQVESILENIT